MRSEWLVIINKQNNLELHKTTFVKLKISRARVVGTKRKVAEVWVWMQMGVRLRVQLWMVKVLRKRRLLLMLLLLMLHCIWRHSVYNGRRDRHGHWGSHLRKLGRHCDRKCERLWWWLLWRCFNCCCHFRFSQFIWFLNVLHFHFKTCNKSRPINASITTTWNSINTFKKHCKRILNLDVWSWCVSDNFQPSSCESHNTDTGTTSCGLSACFWNDQTQGYSFIHRSVVGFVPHAMCFLR